MAADNRLLNQFNLDGIPPAPRGMPQIEVKFDIDQNGILNVSAKDVGTGKEQSVKIEQGSGLSDEEIEKMRADADANAEDDAKRRALADTRNEADQMCFSIEKTIKENEDKLQDSDKEPLQQAVDKVREAAKGEDVDAIKSAVSELEQASHALSKTLYETGAGEEQAGAGGEAEAPSAEDDDVVDAEYEVKDS